MSEILQVNGDEKYSKHYFMFFYLLIFIFKPIKPFLNYYYIFISFLIHYNNDKIKPEINKNYKITLIKYR